MQPRRPAVTLPPSRPIGTATGYPPPAPSPNERRGHDFSEAAAGPSAPVTRAHRRSEAGTSRQRRQTLPSRRDDAQTRQRAITLQSPPRGLELVQTSKTDPMLPEMQKTLLHGLEQPINDFVSINHRSEVLALDWAAEVGHLKSLPSPSSSAPDTSDSPVGKPAFAFPSAEDYAYFTLRSIIVTHLYNSIFRPFHPAGSAAENSKMERAYQAQRGLALQIDAAKWRANQFLRMDSIITPSRRAQILHEISTSIHRVWLDTLEVLPGELVDLPETFVSGVEAIVGAAYDWHRVAKTEVAKLDFEPFAAQPLEPFDADRMEPFERIRGAVQDGSPIVSAVSLGLVASAAFRDRRVSHVQFKTGVLIEEWLEKPGATSMSRGKAAGSSGPSRTPAMVPSAPTPAATPAAPPPRPKKCICF